MSHFHRATHALMGHVPERSISNLIILEEREAKLNISFPASIREWYAQENGEGLLGLYSNCDDPVPLAELGLPVVDWYESGSRDFVRHGLLWFLRENQGVCNWAVQLDGSVDPPVVVEVDSSPNEIWQPCAERFSEFMYCQVWDHQARSASCRAQEPILDDADLRYLQETFKHEPKTKFWASGVNWRFSSPSGRIRVYYSEQHGADWHITAPDANHLLQLIRAIWECGTLKKTLYGVDFLSQRVLKELRN